jgi:tetratricopeptide (TPR) repeat protein
MAPTLRCRVATMAALAVLTMLPVKPSAAAQSAPTGREPPDSLEMLLLSADLHHRQGRFADAHRTLAAALARVWTARGSVWLSQTTATNTGYAEADSAASAAVQFAKASEDPRLLADALELSGRVMYSRRINLAEGDYEEPLRLSTEALALRRKAGDVRGMVESMFRVGLIHERKGEGEQAIAIYEEAMRLAGNDHPLERSNLARHLGYQYQRRGDLDRALELFQQSLALREEAGFTLTRPPALNSIGDLYRRKKDYGKAMEYGRRALAEAERLGAPRFRVMALISLGETHQALGENPPAVEHFRRAEAFAREIGYVSGVEEARERLSAVPAP